MRVQRIDLPDEVSARVYESMKQNFAKIASHLRAEGQKPRPASAPGPSASARKSSPMPSSDALGVRGEADAEAAADLRQGLLANPEFYAFYRSLQAYEGSLGKDGDVLVLSPDSEFFRY